MNRDLFLSILALDSYNRGYDSGLSGLSNLIGTRIGNATIKADDVSQKAKDAGFYAVAYEWDGKTVISYRGTDGLDDVYKGWTTGLGWTDQDQANLALEFYQAATERDPFAYEIPTDIILTGHSLGGGLAGFVSVLSGAEAVMFDHMPYGRAALETYLGALAELGEAIDQFTSSGEELINDIGTFMSGKRFVTRALLESMADIVTLVQSGSDYVDAVKAVGNGDYGRGLYLRGPQFGNGLQSAYNTDGEILEQVRDGSIQDKIGWGLLVADLAVFRGALNVVLEPFGIDSASVQQMGLDAVLFESFVNHNPELLTYGATFSQTSLIDQIAKHSMSLLVTLQYAKVSNVDAAWQAAARYILPELNDDAAAKQLGRVKGTTGEAAEGDQMATAIAYSAIDEGERPFGDQGIRAFFNDAVELGTALSLANVSDSFKGVADDIGTIMAQYAGRLAFADVEDSEWSAGVLSLNGSVAKIVKLEHAWRRLDGRNDDGFQVAPFPG